MRLVKREHPEAREELRDAVFWYDDRQPGLGENFYDAVDEAVARISDWPRSAPVLPGWVGTPTVRIMAVMVFPYRVLYCLTDTSFVILAYGHKPGPRPRTRAPLGAGRTSQLGLSRSARPTPTWARSPSWTAA